MKDKNQLLSECIGFEWDEHNSEKIWNKHKVSISECEQMFFSCPLIIADDLKHSTKESRFYALGQTDLKRLLFTVFTIRKKRIRLISARDMSKKERKVFKSHEK